MTELKPCPFCGGCGHVYEDGRLSIKPYNFPKWYITCKKCGVKTPTAKIEQVVRIWNRRVNDDAMDMAIEALKCSETPKSSEQNAETAQADHIADTGRKVEQTAEIAQNVQNGDLIQRKTAIEAIIGMIDRFERLLADIRESKGDDSVCGMCEYDGAYMGQSGDWCNECPGFDKDDCFKLSDRCRKRWIGDITLPSAQPDNQINLCDSCDYLYPECPSEKDDVIFGNGIGNDNICACNKYKPSAQPEIIRCKDCKHWRFDHTCREHSLVSPMMANEFCSRAERREG